jgi:hypothetical protein
VNLSCQVFVFGDEILESIIDVWARTASIVIGVLLSFVRRAHPANVQDVWERLFS